LIFFWRTKDIFLLVVGLFISEKIKGKRPLNDTLSVEMRIILKRMLKTQDVRV
jgi:hypothetical protein